MTAPQPSINTLVSAREVPYTPAQQENLQELLSEFDNIGTSQNIDYRYSQVTNTHKGVETVITHNTRDLHPDINALDAIANISTTMNPSISTTKKLPSVLP